MGLFKKIKQLDDAWDNMVNNTVNTAINFINTKEYVSKITLGPYEVGTFRYVASDSNFVNQKISTYLSGIFINENSDIQQVYSMYLAMDHMNFGAQKHERIRRGVRSAFVTSVVFSLAVSVLVFVFARPLMLVFVRPEETEILRVGVEYLRIEGAFYPGIGILFLLYGYYRAVRMPGMSVVLTVLSLGVRVALSYWLASTFVGVSGIWWSIPIGWALADVVGIFCYYRMKITAPICHRRERFYESYL